MLNIKDCPYADQIKAAMNAYLPEWAWEWGAAQLYQESAWNAMATNKDSGAMGIGQFMPETWQEMIDRMGFVDTASAYDPTFAIPAYAYYMRSLRKQWSAPRPETDRRRLAQASYNAGLGNILRAQKLSGDAVDSGSILAALPQVTGATNAKQTQDYVLKINQWFLELTGLTGAKG